MPSITPEEDKILRFLTDRMNFYSIDSPEWEIANKSFRYFSLRIMRRMGTHIVRDDNELANV
mgnify:CR=1